MLHARGPARGKKDEKRRGEADPYNDGAECFSSCGGLAERNKNKIEKERGEEKGGGGEENGRRRGTKRDIHAFSFTPLQRFSLFSEMANNTFFLCNIFFPGCFLREIESR